MLHSCSDKSASEIISDIAVMPDGDKSSGFDVMVCLVSIGELGDDGGREPIVCKEAYFTQLLLQSMN